MYIYNYIYKENRCIYSLFIQVYGCIWCIGFFASFAALAQTSHGFTRKAPPSILECRCGPWAFSRRIGDQMGRFLKDRYVEILNVFVYVPFNIYIFKYL